MNAVIDTSVVLRILLREPRKLREWNRIRTAYASRLLPLELARVIDRLRLTQEIDDVDVERLHVSCQKVLRSIDIVGIGEPILHRATLPMPTVVSTLDSIHLATALEVKAKLEASVVLATHDDQLARAARSSGLTVIGV